jgi:probable HAF family extracellular repeat protein
MNRKFKAVLFVLILLNVISLTLILASDQRLVGFWTRTATDVPSARWTLTADGSGTFENDFGPPYPGFILTNYFTWTTNAANTTFTYSVSRQSATGPGPYYYDEPVSPAKTYSSPYTLSGSNNNLWSIETYSYMKSTANEQSAGTISYTALDLGTLGGDGSSGTGINNAGQVTGSSSTTIPDDGVDHAFLYSNGKMTDLGTLGGISSLSNSINDLGQVTGNSLTAAGIHHAFLYSNGTMKDLNILGDSISSGLGINNLGAITGAVVPTTSYISNGFIYVNGNNTDLFTLAGNNSPGFSINDSGQVTGYATNFDNKNHAFIYKEGVLRDIGTLGGNYSYGHSINNLGQVAGYSTTTGNRARHAFVYMDEQMKDIGTLGGSESFATSINNSGHVVGYSSAANNQGVHLFLYKDGIMYDVNNSISPNSGVRLVGNAGFGGSCREINDWGQIIANGLVGNNGRAILLNPVKSQCENYCRNEV